MDRLTKGISRNELIVLVDDAARRAGVAPTHRERLVAAVKDESVTIFAHGLYVMRTYSEDCLCPAARAGYVSDMHNGGTYRVDKAVEGFPSNFDDLVRTRIGAASYVPLEVVND